MKIIVRTFVFAVAALTLATSVAEARPGHGGGYGRGGGWHRGDRVRGGGVIYYPRPVCGFDYPCGTTYVGGTVACSPATFEGNVTTTDKVLKALAATPEFVSAVEFKSQIAKISAKSDAAQKATDYMNLAGIDSADNSAIVAFVGARDAKGAWITDLQRNASLTNAQAEKVASSLQNALRGNLK